MKSRTLHTLSQFAMLVLLTQSLLLAQPYCAGGGWFYAMNTAEMTGCCPETTHSDSAGDWCHQPVSATHSAQDCNSCSSCNFEADQRQPDLLASAIPVVTTDHQLTTPCTGELAEFHKEATPASSIESNSVSHPPSGPLYIVHQSFLN
jgi:hypothetical protein